MDVGVYRARQHVAACGVELDRAVQFLAQGSDALSDNAHVGREDAAVCDERAVADHYIHSSNSNLRSVSGVGMPLSSQPRRR